MTLSGAVLGQIAQTGKPYPCATTQRCCIFSPVECQVRAAIGKKQPTAGAAPPFEQPNLRLHDKSIDPLMRLSGVKLD